MNWTDLGVSMDDYYQALSLYTIKNDCTTISELIFRHRNPILALGLMPYYALFCIEIEKYLNEQGVEIKVPNNSPFKTEQIRLKLKQFNDRFGRASRYVSGLDESQDELFKEKIWLKFIRRLNINYNLGIYYYDNSIIGNTQYYYSLFQERKVTTKRIHGNDVKDFSRVMGNIVGTVSRLLKDLPGQQPVILDKDFEIYYQDINTNKKQIFLLEQKTPKSTALLLLHTLSNINFARLILRPILIESTWKIRVMYITMYYSYLQLELLKDKSGDATLISVLTTCVNKLNPIFNSDFRSCMMHYAFINDGRYIIDNQYADFSLPMYGLVESCFGGLSYELFLNQVTDNLNIMAKSIEGLLVLSSDNLSKL